MIVKEFNCHCEGKVDICTEYQQSNQMLMKHATQKHKYKSRELENSPIITL